MNTPLISVIVPVYNVAEYLSKSLDSILAQSYSNIEILLIDDGSTDGSTQICEEYASQDGRVKLYRQPNQGVSAARNLAMSLAQGEYFAFVDSDDWLDEDALEYHYNLLEGSKARLSITSHYFDGVENLFVRYPYKEAGVISSAELMRDLNEDITVRNFLWDKMFGRELFEGVEFPLGRPYQDMAIMHRVIDRTDRVAVGVEPKYHYMMRETSTTRSKPTPKRLYQLFLSSYEQRTYMYESGVVPRALRTLIDRGVALLDELIRMPKGEAEREQYIAMVREGLISLLSYPYKAIGLSRLLKLCYIKYLLKQ